MDTLKFMRYAAFKEFYYTMLLKIQNNNKETSKEELEDMLKYSFRELCKKYNIDSNFDKSTKI